MWGTVKPQSRLVRRQNGVLYSLMPLKGVEIVQISSSTNKKNFALPGKVFEVYSRRLIRSSSRQEDSSDCCSLFMRS